MKYKILLEKENDGLYCAHCPVMPDIRASGITMNAALSNLRQELLCYLHDADAEYEIVFEGHDRTAGVPAELGAEQRG